MSSDFIRLLMKNNYILKVYNNRMIIQKLESVDEILKKPASAEISYYTLEQLKSEFD